MKLQSRDLARILRLPPSAIPYQVTRLLRKCFPDLALERCENGFGFGQFAQAGLCTLTPLLSVVADYELGYNGADEQISRSARHIWLSVEWEDETFYILSTCWRGDPFSSTPGSWILGPSPEHVRNFYKRVMDYNSVIRDEILVFNGGCFSKDPQLFKDIQSSRLDNLVLPGNRKEELAVDCAGFFESRALYESYGVPWKRGYLLVGPPGNGKSHAVKALVNHLRQPCVYVQSFQAEHSTEHHVMRALFERARRTTPCIMVLEDLDSLINDSNRAFFLNELDGFASNHGIMTIATTNHPERLDPAILERPSRFDRKYSFDLPAEKERVAYLGLWNDRLEAGLQLSARGVTRVAKATEGFSFAYLKELVLSSMMAWMRKPGASTMDSVMGSIVEPLSEQLKRPAAAAVGG